MENFRNLLRIRDVSVWTCEELVSKLPLKNSGCPRQVFASEEVAAHFVLMLRDVMNITGTIVRCSACRLIHVNEVKRP